MHEWFRAMKRWLYRDCKLLFAAAAMGLGFTLCCAAAGAIAYAEQVQEGIADAVVRFHVLANSDSTDDQAVKLLVRDGVLAYLGDTIPVASDKAETCAAINARLNGIEETADAILRANGYTYGVHAAVEPSWFPTRVYGDVTLPAGTYDALRIVLGAGEGRNWWCMIFPALCYVDGTQSSAADSVKTELKGLLTADEYALVMQSGGAEIRVKLKIVELWQAWKVNWTRK